MSAEAQLERLLYILPLASQPDGVRIDELEQQLGTAAATILRDLEEATARAYYHPAGSVESFTILIDGDRVQVHAPDQFRRPVRLNQREALALGLGLRAMAAEVAPARQSDALDLAARLETQLAAPDDVAIHGDGARQGIENGQAEVEYEPELMLAVGDDVFRGILADAIDRRHICTLWYVKAGEHAPQERRIAPHRLVFGEGRWYVAAHDLDRDDLRFFRLDRVLGVDVLDEEQKTVPDVDLSQALQGSGVYMAEEDQEVVVRYDSTVARWITEEVGVSAEQDGSVTVTHRVADPRWLARHVLKYGGAASVTEPAEARRWVARAAQRVMDADGAGRHDGSGKGDGHA